MPAGVVDAARKHPAVEDAAVGAQEPHVAPAAFLAGQAPVDDGLDMSALLERGEDVLRLANERIDTRADHACKRRIDVADDAVLNDEDANLGVAQQVQRGSGLHGGTLVPRRRGQLGSLGHVFPQWWSWSDGPEWRPARLRARRRTHRAISAALGPQFKTTAWKLSAVPRRSHGRR